MDTPERSSDGIERSRRVFSFLAQDTRVEVPRERGITEGSPVPKDSRRDQRSSEELS